MRSQRFVGWGAIVLFSLSVLVLTGCPLIRPTSYQYTSADRSPNRSYWYENLLPGTAVDDTSGEGESQREVVEPDVIRRVGNLLFVLNQYRGLTIANLDTQEVLSQAPTYGYPRDLYVVDDLAYVLVGYATNYVTDGNQVKMEAGSRVFAVDISDPASPSVVSTFNLEGDFVDSRMVGDVLYAVSAEFKWYWEGGTTGTVSTGWEKAQTSESWVTSINVSDPSHLQVVDSLSFAGYGGIIQATNFAMFVASSDYETNTSTITYVDISDPVGAISVRGAQTVKGYIADRFKMDAWNNVLRVVSNTDWRDRNVYVTTIDLTAPDTLPVLGETLLEGAAGETLFATRFDGPLAYIVTYFVVDPLFVLDLSNPAEPRLAGTLEVPGWSVYIEPQGDRLIALGVDDSEGTRRVKVSLFDVSNPDQPSQKAVVSMGENWAWSSAFSDVKAFTVLDDTLIVPFSGYNNEGSYERLQFVGYTADSLELKGSVDVQGQILRSFEYNDLYYGVTTEQLATIDASGSGGPVVIGQVTLAEYVSDVQELSASLTAEILVRYEDNEVEVRTTTPTGLMLGSCVIKGMTNITQSYAYGSSVVLVSSGWDQSGYYDVAVADCSTPEAPVAGLRLRVDVQPYWGWYWYDYGYDGPIALMADTASSKSMPYYRMWWPWYNTSENGFLLGDVLALRCTKDKYDTTVGTDTPNQGLALINLASGEWTQTVGLGYGDIQSIDAANGRLYVSTKDSVGTDMLLRPLCANYLQTLQLDPLVEGVKVNVPGTFLQYNPETGVLVLEDFQYKEGWTYQRTLQSVSWKGGDVAAPIDSQAMPDNNSVVLPRGERVYFDSWQDQDGYYIGEATVGGDGQLSLGHKVKVTDTWASLLDAQGADAYVTVGGGALAHYDFSDEPVLDEVVPVMSSPQRLRFGAATVYAPLGYAGVARLPL